MQDSFQNEKLFQHHMTQLICDLAKLKHEHGCISLKEMLMVLRRGFGLSVRLSRGYMVIPLSLLKLEGQVRWWFEMNDSFSRYCVSMLTITVKMIAVGENLVTRVE